MRSRMARPEMIRRVLLASIAGAAVGLGVVGAPVVMAAGHFTHPGLFLSVGLLIGWAYVGVGLFAWWRRPDNRVGPLMTAVGFAWFGSGLWLDRTPVLHTTGLVISGLYYPVLIHLVLAFPSGRLGPPGRRVVLASYVAAVLGQLVPLPFLDSAAVDRCRCGRNLLLIHRDDHLATGLLTVPRVVGTGLLLAVALLLIRRWRESTAPERRALACVLWAGALVIGLSCVRLAADAAGVPSRVAEVIGLLVLFGMLLVPGAFLAGLAQTRFFHVGVIGGLVARLAEGPTAGSLRDALATALGDDSVQVVYWLSERSGYGDQAGAPVALPAESSGRAVARIARNGQPIGAIIYDAALAEQPRLVRSVTAAATLALENERLQAELRARVAQLERSRAQVVEAGEAERRRLERDLHDGAQQRLVSMKLTLALTRDQVAGGSGPSGLRLLDAARTELDCALAELRELARGLYPAVLTSRGLTAAARSLAARSPVSVRLDIPPLGRLPGPVESAAYFVVAESLTNVAKHAQATAATVRLARQPGSLLVEVGDNGAGGADPDGSGLRGLRARVVALDGQLQVISPCGGGTLVRAEIPLPAPAPQLAPGAVAAATSGNLAP